MERQSEKKGRMNSAIEAVNEKIEQVRGAKENDENKVVLSMAPPWNGYQIEQSARIEVREGQCGSSFG